MVLFECMRSDLGPLSIEYTLQGTVIVELFLQWMDFGVFHKLVCTCKK